MPGSKFVFLIVMSVIPLFRFDVVSRADSKISGMHFQVYNETDPEVLDGEVWVDQINTDREKKFLFKIGVIPVVVAQGITVEIL